MWFINAQISTKEVGHEKGPQAGQASLIEHGSLNAHVQLQAGWTWVFREAMSDLGPTMSKWTFPLKIFWFFPSCFLGKLLGTLKHNIRE